MKIHIDTNKCTGHAQCAANAPDVYDLDDLGYAIQPAGEIPPEKQAAARLGAEACPERAITIEE